MMRYIPRIKLDPILGEHVQVHDTRLRETVTLFTGAVPAAWAKAERRCGDLNNESQDN